MKKIVLFFLSSIPLLSKAQNLIVNPGAELTPVGNGWTQLSGNWGQRMSDPTPKEGNAYFYAGANALAELYQDINVSGYSKNIDKQLQWFSFIGYIHTWPQSPSDQSREIVEYRDINGIILDTFDSQLLQNTSVWQQVSDVRKAPAGTRTIRIRLIADRNAGSNNDGYHDSLSLVALPVGKVSLEKNQKLPEGKTGSKQVKFSVTLSGFTGTDTVSIRFATQDSTAIADTDYISTSGKILFFPGKTSDTITVLINGDKMPESDELFSVLLSNSKNALIGKDSVSCTIKNDDEATIFTQRKDINQLAAFHQSLNVQVSPNPVLAKLNLQVQGDVKKVQVHITDMSGKKYMTKSFSNMYSISLDVDNIPSGIYFVSVVNDTEIKTLKIYKK